MSARQRSQLQMFYAAHRQVAETNDTFMELVKAGLTREDLARNIVRRPALWRRFENWLPVLPSK